MFFICFLALSVKFITRKREVLQILFETALLPQVIRHPPHDRFVPTAVAHEYVFWGGDVDQDVFSLGRMFVF
jgi:hypothetical protein